MSTTVLIIDDDPVQRRLAEAMVRRLGFEARIAENGLDGLNLLRAGEGIDVVLLDLVMPGGIDGLGVLAEMRKAGIDTPVIVQTSNGSIDAVVNAMRAGAVDFVVKPAGASGSRCRSRTRSASINWRRRCAGCAAAPPVRSASRIWPRRARTWSGSFGWPSVRRNPTSRC